MVYEQVDSLRSAEVDAQLYSTITLTDARSVLFIARCAKTEVSYSRSWQLPILTAEKCFLSMLTKHFETMFLCLILSGSFSSIIFQPGRRTPSKIVRLGMLCQRFKTGLTLNGHSKSPPLLS